MSIDKNSKNTGIFDTRPDLDALLTLEPSAIDSKRVYALTRNKIAGQLSARGIARSATAAKRRPRNRSLRVAAAIAAALAVGGFGSIGIASAATGTDPISLVTGIFVPKQQIFEDTLAVDPQAEEHSTLFGLRFSNITKTYQGTALPDGVAPKNIYWGCLPLTYADEQTGTAKGDYEYIFVDYTVANETDETIQYFFNGARLFVLGTDNEVLGKGTEVCYYNGIDLEENLRIMLNGQEYDPHAKKSGEANYTPEQIEAKQAGSIKIQPGETRAIHVAVIISRRDLAKGELYFTPSTSQGIPTGEVALPWYFTKLDN
jgi:hypothetical protein